VATRPGAGKPPSRITQLEVVMRALRSARFVSACTLILACSDTTGPTPDPTLRRDPVQNAALRVAPTNATIGQGETLRFSATLTQGAALRSGGVPVSWFSSDESVATVDASGLVRGVNVGTAQITAAMGFARSSTTITVIGMRKKVQEPLPCLLADHPGHPTC
jgi:hypothetical protein